MQDNTALSIPQEPGYAVIRQEDAQAFSRQVNQLAAVLLALQREVDAMRQDNARRVTINHQQAKGLAARMRDRAAAICEKYNFDAKKHAAFFRGAMKKAVLQGWGISDLHDLPLKALEMTIQQIDGWVPGIAAVRKRRAMDGRAD